MGAVPLSLEPRQLLDGKYLVSGAIGEGGFGKVVLAEDQVVSGRQVAIKILRESDEKAQDERLADLMLKQNSNNDCFENNRFVCRLLNKSVTNSWLKSQKREQMINPFFRYNYDVVTETPTSWDKDGRVGFSMILEALAKLA